MSEAETADDETSSFMKGGVLERFVADTSRE